MSSRVEKSKRNLPGSYVKSIICTRVLSDLSLSEECTKHIDCVLDGIHVFIQSKRSVSKENFSSQYILYYSREHLGVACTHIERRLQPLELVALDRNDNRSTQFSHPSIVIWAFDVTNREGLPPSPL